MSREGEAKKSAWAVNQSGIEISEDQIETAASEYVVFDSARNYTVLFGIKKTSEDAPPLGTSAFVVVR